MIMLVPTFCELQAQVDRTLSRETRDRVPDIWAPDSPSEILQWQLSEMLQTQKPGLFFCAGFDQFCN